MCAQMASTDAQLEGHVRQPEIQKSWNKTRLQLLLDVRKEVADVTGCNVLMDFVF